MTEADEMIWLERRDPRLDRLVAADARPETVADGFRWAEGPVWDRGRNCLYFSDVKANRVYRWTATAGAEEFLVPSGWQGPEPFAGPEPGANGLTIDAEGRLVLCEHGDRRIRRREPDGTMTVLVDRYQGRRLNSPNDLVFRSDGWLYFTDPCYGLPETTADPGRELPFAGVFRVSPAGEVELLIDELGAPNGIAFSPDERTLYLSNSDHACPAWLAYDLDADGRLGEGRLLRDAREYRRQRPGSPDGLKLDRDGYLFATGPGGVYVFAPDGAHLGTILTHSRTGNVAWGEDGSTLFICADSRLLRMRVLTRGAGW
ncbi:MAG: SMP-30/gluconolactonase/LRE family protein [Rhodospirillales bacterium]